jgi:hypothetical protein
LNGTACAYLHAPCGEERFGQPVLGGVTQIKRCSTHTAVYGALAALGCRQYEYQISIEFLYES